MSDLQRYRVLCFHGYRQNAKIFQSKTGALRKALKSCIDFEFISSPLLLNLQSNSRNGADDEEKAEETADEDIRSWWFSNRELRTFSSKEVTDIADGFQESVEYVLNYIQQQGPFDGLLGFSQGASFMHLLLALKQFDVEFRFIILFAGFKSLSSVHHPLMDVKLTVPSFHVYGMTDEIIQHAQSAELAECFVNPLICTHPGKHCIPPVKEFRDKLLKFLDQLHASK